MSNDFEEVEESTGFTVHGESISLEEMNKIEFNENTVLPPSNNVRLLIKKVEVKANKAETKKKVNIMFQVVDGIEVNGELKFKNAVFFQNGAEFNQFVFFADPSVHTSDYFKERKYLKPIKDLVTALGLTGFDPDKINEDMKDGIIVANILQAENNKFDEESKKWVPDGTFNNYVDKIRADKSEASEATSL